MQFNTSKYDGKPGRVKTNMAKMYFILYYIFYFPTAYNDNSNDIIT